MYRCHDIPAHLPEEDKALIARAYEQSWEYIEEEKASTEEAREILHDIAVAKYHLEEFSCGTL